MDDLLREVPAEKEYILISLELSKRLDKYRAFRHFSIHGYGVLLDKEKLMPLATNLPDLWSDFESEVDTFIKSSIEIVR